MGAFLGERYMPRREGSALPPLNRQMPVITLPSRNFVWGHLKQDSLHAYKGIWDLAPFLVDKRSAGVAPQVNLRIPLHISNEARKRGDPPWFWISEQMSPEVQNTFLKLSLIHASEFIRFAEFSESCTPFRNNSNVLQKLVNKIYWLPDLNRSPCHPLVGYDLWHCKQINCKLT